MPVIGLAYAIELPPECAIVMAAGLYLVFTVLAAIIAVLVPAVRRWFRSRRRPLRVGGMIALTWFVVFVVLAVAGGTPPEQGTNAAARTVPSTTTAAAAAPTSTTSAPAPAPSCHAGSNNGQPVPDPTCTPGATDANVTADNIDSTICLPGWADKVRPPASYTDQLRAQQIAVYDYADAQLADYTEDHLIPLELGGNPTDPKNLWPEPGNAANGKDAVETALSRAVCSRQVTLTAAQRAIAADWTTAETVLGLNTPTSTRTTPPPAAPAPRPAPTKAHAPSPAPVQHDTPAPADPLAGRYHAGEFCSKANLGVTTIATNGATITCRRDGNYNRWED
ncbi:hypothetical protein LWP59_26965 [Amycolatopsis acidiphila]|uniref:hypothetical protein n=1 Tax=Amycolatopsis acidiphila TaxID=715473 RepID=UPI001643F7EA|nr:hypothetical protein [Amycolatopsis acidiphila]UIJ57769.1 hypothetical protein LWP59_26965 [Amycolatopsis acidiphila]GHG87584.1 hypothetical protein GCM10017788_61310 [Amycolatopsis acidiphila]